MKTTALLEKMTDSRHGAGYKVSLEHLLAQKAGTDQAMETPPKDNGLAGRTHWLNLG